MARFVARPYGRMRVDCLLLRGGNAGERFPYLLTGTNGYAATALGLVAEDQAHMSSNGRKTALVRPRWDGSRVLFEIEVAGQPVACAISRSALQGLSGRRQYAVADLLRCFDAARPRIEAIAVSKFNSGPESISGIVSVWDDDVEDAPPVATKGEPLAPV